MIPVLYSPTETVFTSNGMGRLTDTTSCIVHEQRNGIFELEMEMPTAGIHFDDIVLGSIIMAKPSPNRTAQPFRVYSIEKTMGDMMATICAEHIAYQLNMIPVMPYTAANAIDAIEGLATHAAEPNPFTFWTDVTRAGTYTQTIPSSARARLQGEQGSIVQTYGGEIEFDGWDVKLWLNRGIDRGTTIRYGKNLMSLEQEQSIQNTITGIVPYWVGMEGETETVMWLEEIVRYSTHAPEFPTPRTVCIDMSGDFQEKPTEEELRAAADKYIEDNNIGVPDVGFDISFVTLAQTTEYATIALLERIDLCDFVTVIFDDFGISAKAKVVETYFDNLRERYTQIRIGDQRFTLSDTIAKQSQEIVESEAKQTNSFHQALEQATALINGDLTGASVITQTDTNGNPVGIIFMDTDNPATATNCIKINSNGIGFSQNGPVGDYTSAWTITGHFVADFIDSGILNANLLKAGKITSADGSTWWDLENNQFYLSAQGGTIQGSEIETESTTAGVRGDVADILQHFQILDDASLVIETSNGMSITLSQGTVTVKDQANNTTLITGTEVTANILTAAENLFIGNHKFLSRSNGTNTTVVYVGD